MPSELAINSARHEDAYNWVTRSIGHVLGYRGPRFQMASDKNGKDKFLAEIENVRDLLKSRYRVDRDERTGAVRIEIQSNGAGSMVNSECDPNIDRLKRMYLVPVRNAVAEVDALAGNAENVRNLLRHIDENLKVLDANLCDGESIIYAELLVAELIRENGLFAELYCNMAPDDPCLPADDDCEGRVSNVGQEQQIAAILAASHSLEHFLMELRQLVRIEGDCVDHRTFWHHVTSCAVNISEQSVLISQQLGELGIGKCELERIEVPLKKEAHCGTAVVKQLSASVLLLLLQSEPRRWARLAAIGGRSQRRQISLSAEQLQTFGKALESCDLPKQLKLEGNSKKELTATIARLAAIIAHTVLLLRCCDKETVDNDSDHKGERSKANKQTTSQTPPEDQSGM